MRNRKRTVAKLVPVESADALEDEERRMAAAGLLRRAEKKFGPDFWRIPAPKIRPGAIPRCSRTAANGRDVALPEASGIYPCRRPRSAASASSKSLSNWVTRTSCLPGNFARISSSPPRAST